MISYIFRKISGIWKQIIIAVYIYILYYIYLKLLFSIGFVLLSEFSFKTMRLVFKLLYLNELAVDQFPLTRA